MSILSLGIDIGGTSYKYGIIDENNTIIYQHSVPTNPNQDNNDAITILFSIIDDCISKYDISSTGIGLPCVVNNDKIIMAPNLPN